MTENTRTSAQQPLTQRRFKSVNEAVEAIRDALASNMIQGHGPEDELCYFLVATGMELTIHTVSFDGDEDEALIDSIRIWEPVAAITVDPKPQHSAGHIVAISLAVQRPDFHVDVYLLDTMNAVHGFQFVTTRHLDDCQDVPLLPEAREWEYSGGEIPYGNLRDWPDDEDHDRLKPWR